MSPAKFNLNRNNSILNKSTKGWWTHPYYLCEDKSWLLSYISPIIEEKKVCLKIEKNMYQLYRKNAFNS